MVSDPAWRRLSKLLKDAAVLADRSRPGRKERVTTWADGGDYRRFADELGTGRLALLLPTDNVPPTVAYTVPTQHHN